MLFLYSDGGPDHRTNYKSVQIASVAMFISLDLDMFVAARTGPMLIYCNPAERAMSCLNLALQNLSICRESAGNMELWLSLKSLKALRKASERDHSIQDSFVASIKPVMDTLKERFRKLTWQGERIIVYDE